MMSVRQQAARFLRGMPGGRTLAAAARLPIQAAQYVCGRFSPRARIPRWFRRGHNWLYSGRCEEAIALFDRIISLDPAASSSYYRRAVGFFKLGRWDESLRDCETALGMRELPDDDRSAAHMLHSLLLLRLGDLQLCVDEAVRGRWWRDFRCEPPAVTDAADPVAVTLRAEALNDLAEESLNARCDWATARILYRREAEHRSRCDHRPDAGQTLILDEEWTRNIGHQALLDYILKMKDLGWTSWKKLVLLAPRSKTANATFLECFRDRAEIITDDPSPVKMRHIAKSTGFRVSSLLELPDGSMPYLPEGLGIVQEEWERQGRSPQLALQPDIDEFGRKQLRAMGVPDGAWFVGLHVRSGSFYREGLSSEQSHRNAPIESYVPAIEEIVRRGGWVIRMGDKSMPPLPRIRGAVDYARSRFKSDRMDIFLCAKSRFYIAVASGLGNVPCVFGVPCLTTNWVSNALPFYSRNDLFLPKLLRRTTDGSILTFSELLSSPVRDASYSRLGLRLIGMEAIDNTPKELRTAAAAMLDHLEGKAPHTPESLARARCFAELARSQGLRGFARVVPDFLARHRELLQ